MDVDWGYGREREREKEANDDDGGGLGCHTGVLPHVDVSLRRTVPAVAGDIAGLLVRSLCFSTSAPPHP